jgi:hypothetical protein
MSKERETPADVWFAESQLGIENKILKAVHSKKDFTLSYYIKSEKNEQVGEGSPIGDSEAI